MTIYPPCSGSEWLMEQSGFVSGHVPHYESIFTLANGYAGVRASLATNPGMGDPGFYVAGVYDRVHDFTHEIVNLPSWIGMGLNVNGFDVDLRKGEILDFWRGLDMRQGILYTRLTWRDAGMQTTRIETARLMHLADKHVALEWGTVTPVDYSASVQVSSVLDAWSVKYASASRAPRLTVSAVNDLGASGIGLEVVTRQSGIGVAMASQLQIRGGERRSVRADDDRIAESMVVKVGKGRAAAFERRVVFYTSRDTAKPAAAAAQELARVAATRLAVLIRRHTAAWKQVWGRADIRIDGDPQAQKALRFNVFHLASLGNPGDSLVSLGAKGLHGNGYGGLVFWDTEIYMLPFYTHTDPAAARALLQYRHHFLNDARENAKALGHTGAYYPWNSSITGRERPWRGWQEHVGSDIAYGVAWYLAATGDDAFLREAGAELILETARYWQSRVEFDKASGTYMIRGLMGPDEIHGGIDNNSYTNQLVRWHLRRALRAAEELQGGDTWKRLAAKLGITAADLAKWRDIAERMYLKFVPTLNLHEQFDGYLKLKEKAIDRSLSRMQYTGPVQHSFKPTKVAQQADTVLMYYMFAEEFPAGVRAAGYDYYEPRCSHTSSLSRCIFAAVAAQTGRVQEAYRHFLQSAENDFKAGTEMESESGVHAACMGGTWLAAITGFGGVWCREGVLTLNPRLPRQWTRMMFNLAWRGHTVSVEVFRKHVRLRVNTGRLMVRVGTRDVELTPRPIEVPRR